MSHRGQASLSPAADVPIASGALQTGVESASDRRRIPIRLRLVGRLSETNLTLFNPLGILLDK
jgi:hypothetical protein